MTDASPGSDRPSDVTSSREGRVTDAFVTLTRGLADGGDSTELLHELTVTCASLLDVQAVGLLLADDKGVLHVLAASSEQMRLIEVFQLQRDEGPCRDCYVHGAPVSVPDLARQEHRWPQFVPAARGAGFESVHAVPMRLEATTLGAMGLFGERAGALNLEDVSLGQALADVASVVVVQNRALTDKDALNIQLQTALTSRLVLEQAKGVLAQRGDLDMQDAFAVLRQYARDHNLRLTDAAQSLVDRELTPQEVLEHKFNRNAR